MSLLRKRSADLSAFMPPSNGSLGRPGGGAASANESLRSGAVWACLRLRADLISTMPIDVFRTVDGRFAEVPKPPLFVTPSAEMLWHEWVYATQFDLDRFGNTFGMVVSRDAQMRPSQIELTQASDWSILMRSDGPWEYRFCGRPVDKADVWHERQFVVAGLPMGLSPTAYGAWSTGHYLAAQQFALDWFDSGASPSGALKNTEKVVDDKAAKVIKDRFRLATSRRDVFVHGKDWEYVPAAGAASDAKFLDAMKATTLDICRFYGVPADMIDAESSSGSITYANVTQRNLQLLTLNLGPAITRRELTWSTRLLAAPRFVKFNTDAILRMDAKGKLEMIAAGTDAGLYTIDEGRGFLNLEPLTQEQLDKQALIKGPKFPAPGTQTGVPA